MIRTLDELEAVPVDTPVTVTSDRTGRQTFMRVEGGLALDGTTLPLRMFIGAIADGLVSTDGGLDTPAPPPDHGFTLGQNINMNEFLRLPTGTKVQGRGDRRFRTMRANQQFVYDESPDDPVNRRNETGTFTITDLPTEAALADDRLMTLGAAVEQWLSDYAHTYMDADQQNALRELMREHGVMMAVPRRAVTVTIDISGETEVGGAEGIDVHAIVPGVDVESVDDVAVINWEYTIRQTVESAHPNPCHDETLITDEWVRERLAEAGIRVTRFDIAERECDAD